MYLLDTLAALAVVEALLTAVLLPAVLPSVMLLPAYMEEPPLSQAHLAFVLPFVAAVLAFQSGADGRIAEGLKIATVSPELSPGLVSALGCLDYKQIAPHIQSLCASDSGSCRRIGIAALAVVQPRQVVEAGGDF